jgi:hypothetical protein
MVTNTSNAKTRDQALNIIIKQMTNSLQYIPLAYKLEESGCSCCRSEYFDLICKVGNEYKILCYDGYIKHANDCALIRCSCDAPFRWNNINPKEQTYENFISISETFTSIKDNTWYEDFKTFFEQQQENKNIYEYNEQEEIDLSKNYAFYFR